MTIPKLGVDTGRHHVLAFHGQAGPQELEVLAKSRFPRAEWERDASTMLLRPVTGSRPETPPPSTGTLRLSRHSTLRGPYSVDRGTGMETGLPAGTAYLIDAPVERGECPWPGGGDRNGLGRAFPDGLPVRDEARVLDWAIAVARRLGGVLRIGPRADGTPGVLLTPDSSAAVDLTVWSELWLDPEATLAVMSQVLPRAYLNLSGCRWGGPPRGTGDRPVRGAEVLTVEQRAGLHLAADDYDIAALKDPAPMRGYGAVADLALDGMVALEVSGETTLPPVVKSHPWAVHGAVAYRIKWEAADLHDLESEYPSPQHRVARDRAAPLVAEVARGVYAAVGGVITDMMEFEVDSVHTRAQD